MVSLLLSFSTWTEERVDGHRQGLCWPASSIWKYHVLEERKQRQDNFDSLHMPSYLHADPDTRFSQFR